MPGPPGVPAKQKPRKGQKGQGKASGRGKGTPSKAASPHVAVIEYDPAQGQEQFAEAINKWNPGHKFNYDTKTSGPQLLGGGTKSLVEAGHVAGLGRGDALKRLKGSLDNLTKQGLSEEQASKYLFYSLMHNNQNHPARMKTKDIAGQAGGYTPMGQIDAARADPQVQARYVIGQAIPQQIDQNAQARLQLADQYASWLEAGGRVGSSGTKKTGPNPLTAQGYSRSSLGVPKGYELTPENIRWAAMHQAASEQDALHAAQTGVGEVPHGTIVGDFLRHLMQTKTSQTDIRKLLSPKGKAKKGAYLTDVMRQWNDWQQSGQDPAWLTDTSGTDIDPLAAQALNG